MTMQFLIEFTDLKLENPTEVQRMAEAISRQCQHLELSPVLVYSNSGPMVVPATPVLSSSDEEPVEVDLLNLIAVSDEILWDDIPVQTLTYYSNHVSVNVAGSQYSLLAQKVTVLNGKARVKVRGLCILPELTFERTKAMTTADIRELLP
jgi:hypothetical protein